MDANNRLYHPWLQWLTLCCWVWLQNLATTVMCPCLVPPCPPYFFTGKLTWSKKTDNGDWKSNMTGQDCRYHSWNTDLARSGCFVPAIFAWSGFRRVPARGRCLSPFAGPSHAWCLVPSPRSSICIHWAWSIIPPVHSWSGLHTIPLRCLSSLPAANPFVIAHHLTAPSPMPQKLMQHISIMSLQLVFLNKLLWQEMSITNELSQCRANSQNHSCTCFED